MSGGVDSSVAAGLLKNQGYDVYGVFMRQFELFDIDPKYASLMQCSQTEDRESAQAAAQALGIPFEVWDFRNIYHKKVVEYLFKEYRAGHTPNPDCMCNTYVKFGAFLAQAKKHKADFIAAGHYVKKREYRIGDGSVYPLPPFARPARSLTKVSRGLSGLWPEPCPAASLICDKEHTLPSTHVLYTLTIAKDTNKDQSYFLYSLTQKQLQYCLFPLGGYTKPQVRALAKKMKLPNWNKKDSQGICFVGDIPMREFLRSRIPPHEGPVVTTEGKVIGRHQGSAYYTIGQRHGLGLPGGDVPYYVAAIDMKKNTLIVARGEHHPALFKKKLMAKKVNWISGKVPEMPFTCKARIRYRQQLQTCRIDVISAKVGIYKLHVTFSKPQRAITSGQAIVFYKGSTMLGGGIIV